MPKNKKQPFSIIFYYADHNKSKMLNIRLLSSLLVGVLFQFCYDGIKEMNPLFLVVGFSVVSMVVDPQVRQLVRPFGVLSPL